MKRKSLFIPIIASLMMLSACGGPKVVEESSEEPVSSETVTSEEEEIPEVVDIAQFYELDVDMETYEVKAVLDGKLVTIKDQTICGYHGKSVYTSYSDGNYLQNLHGIEFKLKDDVEFDWESAQRDLVDVTGRVKFDGAVCKLVDATYVVTEEGQYVDGEGWNHGCYYFPGSYMNREYWDYYTSGYTLHAVLGEGTFQIATVPSFVAGQDVKFFVNFAGEDVADELTYIPVTIPADSVKFEALAEVLKDAKVGDGFYTMFLFDYTTSGVGLMLENKWSGYAEVKTFDEAYLYANTIAGYIGASVNDAYFENYGIYIVSGAFYTETDEWSDLEGFAQFMVSIVSPDMTTTAMELAYVEEDGAYEYAAFNDTLQVFMAAYSDSETYGEEVFMVQFQIGFVSAE